MNIDLAACTPARTFANIGSSDLACIVNYESVNQETDQGLCESKSLSINTAAVVKG